MNNLSPIKSISLREQVVVQIRQAIIEGQLNPGDHITEKSLTERLQVSRTPIREALILLEREGLVVSITNRGYFVRSFTVQDVDMIFSMRTTLENFAAQCILPDFTKDDENHLIDLIELQRKYINRADFKSVRSTDVAFHQYLMQRANHPLLQRNWEEISAQIAAVLYIRAEAIPDYDEFLAVKDHHLILDAYVAKNYEQVCIENQRINDRVAGECRFAVDMILNNS
ncbi:MAG: GntR family transcriptional regulator [Phototrophicaceae bacterium]